MQIIIWHTCLLYLSNCPTTKSDNVVRNTLQHTDCCNFHRYISQWRLLLSTVTLVLAVLLCGILQFVERPRSVYSTMPQWWHLTVLQYVAASFHLPSVSTANSNTVQYTNRTSNVKYQQSQLLWYPRCCFLSPTSWQPLFVATASLHVCKHRSHYVTQFEVLLLTVIS